MTGPGTEISTIPQLVRVHYDVYANLPTTGLKEGRDFGYATDRRVFYYWDGSAWVPLTIYFYSGLAADIPAAADLPNGSCYHETDTSKLKQVQAGAWATIVDPSTYGSTVKGKASDEVVNNSTTLQNDDDLFFPVAANEIWEFTMLLRPKTIAGTCDFDFAFSIPAASTLWIIHNGILGASSGTAILTAVDGTVEITNDIGLFDYNQFLVKGLYIGGANAGNVQLQWAQHTATAQDTTLMKGSHLIANKVAG